MRGSERASTFARRLLALSLLVSAVPVAGAAEPPASVAAVDVAALSEMMTGSFSSAAQAEKAPDDFYDIRLFMQPIWTGRDDGPWLYVEQAAASALARPYRQRVYHLVDGEAGPRSDVYELPGDPLDYAGAWQDPTLLDAIGPADLVEREGCSIYLRRTSDDGRTVYAGSTRDDACKSVLRGATYATSEVTITDEALTSWDRGFDADGKQVWGATLGPYVFVKEVEAPTE